MQKLAARFIPAADASDRLQSKTCKDEDAVLFQKFGGTFTTPSQRNGGGIGQGQYAVAPSGELLASCASPEPKEVAEMMIQGLAKWEKLPREKRLLPKAPDPRVAERWRKWEKLYPRDGLVLHVVTRDLPREEGENGSPGARGPWNQDYAWFRKEEARAFLPSTPEPGSLQEVPRLLVERLVRFHLLDNVRALNYDFFPREAVEKAKLTATVVEVRGKVVSLRFKGAARASTPEPRKCGYEPTLRGRATYNLAAEKFIAFELLAVGERWGLGNCNQRHDPAPGPMGVVLKLAGDSPAERLPPAFISRYGW